MIRGFYTAVSGMLTSVRRMDVVVSNLANAQTTAYKQERVNATSFSDELTAQLNALPSGTAIGPLVLSVSAQAPELDLSQGGLHATGRAMDVALLGPGFLVTEGPNGAVYTRDGSLTRDAEGYLIASAGGRVQGLQGAIRVGAGEVAIAANGLVSVDGVALDQLQIVEFPPDQVFERVGQNGLVPRGGGAPIPATATTLQAGAVEASNVDLTTAMTTMLELQRAYEVNQRMIQQHDELYARSANDIARPAS